MKRRIPYRVLIPLLLLLSLAAGEIAREHRPTFLRPGLHLYAYVGNAGDGTVSVVDLIGLATVATIPVGASPSGLRAHPTRDQIWGVSTTDGYAWVIDTREGRVEGRIYVGAAPFAVDFSRDGRFAYVAASGANTLSAIDCTTGRVAARAHTGRRPWLARVTPDGKQVLVPNREDSTLGIYDAQTLTLIATVGVAGNYYGHYNWAAQIAWYSR